MHSDLRDNDEDQTHHTATMSSSSNSETRVAEEDQNTMAEAGRLQGAEPVTHQERSDENEDVVRPKIIKASEDPAGEELDGGSSINLLSITTSWLAGIKEDFLGLQAIMSENQQINQDFAEWLEAGAIESMAGQENFLRETLIDIKALDKKTEAERKNLEFAVAEMKKISDRLINGHEDSDP